jgi:hypothetical protein
MKIILLNCVFRFLNIDTQPSSSAGTKEIIKEMLKLKYNLTDQSLLKYSTDLNNIKDYIMSPAQIQSICFKNERIEDCIHEIILESQNP